MKLILLTVLALSPLLPASAMAKKYDCTCRDKDGEDIGGVTVSGTSWNDAVKNANAACKQKYKDAVDGANCDDAE